MREKGIFVHVCSSAVPTSTCYVVPLYSLICVAMNNTLVRVLVAVVAIPVIVWLVFQGGWPFTLFVECLALLGLYEYYTMARAKGFAPNVVVGFASAAVLPVLLHFLLLGETSVGVLFAFPALALGAVLCTLTSELWRTTTTPFANTAITLFGVLYTALGFGTLIGVRALFLASWHATNSNPQANTWGIALLLTMFVAVWMCDSVAYFVGRAFGKHKIAPAISPKKSWEGGIAGLIGASAVFVIAALWFLPILPIAHAIVLGVLVGIVGQVGDFAESWLKRDAGVKDSSQLIPGHGGILDRFDSMLFVAPTVFLYVSFLLLCS